MLVHCIADAGLRNSKASAIVWGDVQGWVDGSGRIAVRCSKADSEERDTVAVTSRAMVLLRRLREDREDGDRVFPPLSGSHIARRIKRAAKIAGLGGFLETARA